MLYHADHGNDVYTPEFNEFRRRLPPRSFNSLGEWIEMVVKPMGVFDEDRIHAPVVVPVKTALNSVNYTGVRLAPWRKDWFEIAQRGVASMMGISNYSDVDLRDKYGRSLRTMDMQELRNLCEARVYNGNEQVLVVNPPEPPISINPIKDQMLRRIVHEIRTDVAAMVGDHLKGTKTYPELAQRLATTDVPSGRRGGVLEQAIRSYLGQIIDRRFVAAYAESEYAHGVPPEHVVDDLTYLLMKGVIASTSASRDDVERCMAVYNNADGLLSLADDAGDSAARRGGSSSKAVDEYRIYEKIGSHGVFQSSMGPDVAMVLKHGYPERKYHVLGAHHHHHHKHHPHHGVHHHPHGHPHHVRTGTMTTTTLTQSSKPLTLHPYSHPVHNSMTWWYGKYPYHYYTRGAGASERERYASSEHFSGGDVRAAARAMDQPYRGDEQKVMQAFYRFGNYAPCPTKSLMEQLGGGGAGSAAAAASESAELVGKKPFLYGARLKYLRWQLKRAEGKGDDEKIAKYTELIKELKEKKQAMNAEKHMESLIQIAIDDAIAEGGYAVPETYAAIAHYFTPIACDMCDSYMLRRKIEAAESKRRAAFVAQDADAAQKYEARQAELQRKHSERFGLKHDYTLSLGTALRVADQMTSVDRMRSVAEALASRAKFFGDVCKPALSADGGDLVTVDSHVTQVAIDRLCKLAIKEGIGAAEQFIDDMINVENSANVDAQRFWMRVRTGAEDYLYGDSMPVELGIEEALAIEGRYAGTRRAKLALRWALKDKTSAREAGAISDDDALRNYLRGKIASRSLDSTEEKRVLRIIKRLEKVDKRSARRFRRAGRGARKSRRMKKAEDAARTAYLKASDDTQTATTRVASSVAKAALPDSDEELGAVKQPRWRSRLVAAAARVSAPLKIGQNTEEGDYEPSEADPEGEEGPEVDPAEEALFEGSGGPEVEAEQGPDIDPSESEWAQRASEDEDDDSAEPEYVSIPKPKSGKKQTPQFSPMRRKSTRRPEQKSPAPKFLPFRAEEEDEEDEGEETFFVPKAAPRRREFAEDPRQDLYPAHRSRTMEAAWSAEQEAVSRGDIEGARAAAREFELARREAAREIRTGGASIFNKMTTPPSMVTDLQADAPAFKPRRNSVAPVDALMVGNKAAGRTLPPGFKTYAQIKAEMLAKQQQKQ